MYVYHCMTVQNVHNKCMYLYPFYRVAECILLHAIRGITFIFHFITACFMKTEEWEKAATHAKNV